jgi:hypothetical protein
MAHAEAIFTNMAGSKNNAFAVYAKYRFLSLDKVHRHYRMAVWARAATNSAHVMQQEINVNGYNQGWQIGTIGTQLLHKTAISLSVFYEHATANKTMAANNAVNYILSTGHLFWPVHYTNYKQTNLNLMAEIIGQHSGNSAYYNDMALSVQAIFNSQTRLEGGYRFQMNGNMTRFATSGFLLRLEHTFFRVLR